MTLLFPISSSITCHSEFTRNLTQEKVKLTVHRQKKQQIDILHFIPRKIYFAGTPSFRMTVVFFLAFRMTGWWFVFCFKYVSLMILLPTIYGKCPIHLLGKHNTGKHVGEGHF